MDLNIEKFDPTTAELQSMAEASKQIIITDFEDVAQVKAVHEQRILLKNTRIKIKDKGEELREDAVKFQRAVIAKQKELIAIIEPEEDRLKNLEEEATLYAIKQERLRKLPERRSRLEQEKVGEQLSDEQVNELDDVSFESLITSLINARIISENLKKEAELKAKQAEIEAKEKELKDKELAMQREADAKAQAERDKELAAQREKERLDAIEQARLDGERQAKEAQAQKEAEEKAKKEREEEEARKAAAKLEKSKKYKAFLESHGCTDVTKGEFKIFETETGYVLFKRIAEFSK